MQTTLNIYTDMYIHEHTCTCIVHVQTYKPCRQPNYLITLKKPLDCMNGRC